MNYLPPEFKKFDILLDNLPPGEAEIILYCLLRQPYFSYVEL